MVPPDLKLPDDVDALKPLVLAMGENAARQTFWRARSLTLPRREPPLLSKLRGGQIWERAPTAIRSKPSARGEGLIYEG